MGDRSNLCYIQNLCTQNDFQNECLSWRHLSKKRALDSSRTWFEMRNEVYAIWRKILPFHDDEETFWAVESVLVDVVYVDDVEAIGSLPVKLNLPTSLHRVFQNFQGAFGPLRGRSTLKKSKIWSINWRSGVCLRSNRYKDCIFQIYKHFSLEMNDYPVSRYWYSGALKGLK